MLPIRLSIYCDGLEAIRKSSLPLRWARGSPTQYDLLGAIWHLRQVLRCQPSFCHVKGHQDAPYSQLDFSSQLNHHMDSRAKAFLRRKPSVSLPSIFMEPWTAYISGEKISGSLQLSLREHCTASDLLTWWSTKQQSQASSFHQIDWDALQKAMTSLKLTRRHWIAKHAAGICGVGTVLQRWKWQDHATCPRCSETEDAAHVWVCRAPSSIQVWEESIAWLDKWMETTQAYPLMRKAICVKLL